LRHGTAPGEPEDLIRRGDAGQLETRACSVLKVLQNR
jgi:hypothetical protein